MNQIEEGKAPVGFVCQVLSKVFVLFFAATMLPIVNVPRFDRSVLRSRPEVRSSPQIRTVNRPEEKEVRR
jgi:hypothetical protein